MQNTIIVADQKIPFLRGFLEQFGYVHYLPAKEINSLSVCNADVLVVRTVTRVDNSLLQSSRVKLVCSATIGYDHIDTDYCRSRGIVWHNAPGCNARSVQQYVVASLLYCFRSFKSLKNKTIGIIGVGNVGSRVEEAANALGMKPLLYDPPRADREGNQQFTDLETIKRCSDVISFHTPLTFSGDYPTYHLADDDFFNSLERAPLIINSARGAVCDTLALKNALATGKISGAVVDCWENEPAIDYDLMRASILATPHIAGYSADGKLNAATATIRTIARFCGQTNFILPQIEEDNPQRQSVDLHAFPSKNRIENMLLSIYNPANDANNLLAKPADFFALRENYTSLRRDCTAYAISGASEEEKRLLQALGFTCL